MDNNEITLKITLSLDKEWASNQTREELIDSIKDKWNSSLGFRGEIKRLSVIRR